MFHHFVIVNKLFIEKFDSFVTIYLYLFILFYFTMMQKIQMQM